jgi:RND family efflux transporter MFP subunit
MVKRWASADFFRPSGTRRAGGPTRRRKVPAPGARELSAAPIVPVAWLGVAESAIPASRAPLAPAWVLAAVFAAAVLVAGCGGGSPTAGGAVAGGGATVQPTDSATFPVSPPALPPAASRAGPGAPVHASPAVPAVPAGVAAVVPAPAAAYAASLPAAGGPPPSRAAASTTTSRPAGYVGVVLARQAVTVAAETDGRLASVAVRVGDVVHRGQELATLSMDELHDEMAVVQATVSAARSEQRRTELELDRTRDRRARRELHPELYAEEDLASARNAEQEAGASVESAKARVAEEVGHLRQLETRLQHAVLRAPIDGRVALRYLDAGALVRSGAPVVRLISTGQFMLRFAVPPEQAAAIRKGAAVAVRLDSLPMTLAGRVSQVAPRLDTASQMVFVEAELQVPGALLERLQDGLPGRVTVGG